MQKHRIKSRCGNNLDVVTTTLELRRKKLRSNIINNNALLAWLKDGGRMDPFSGGREIMEEFDSSLLIAA